MSTGVNDTSEKLLSVSLLPADKLLSVSLLPADKLLPVSLPQVGDYGLVSGISSIP
jgi:hypothetical protein